MPPRRSARVAAVVERECSALPPLPQALVHAIFTALPVDARARCAAVCRGWRAVLTDPSFWLRLDLSAASGVTCAFRYALLRGAAALARGKLQALDVSGFDGIAYEWLRHFVLANAGYLRELRVEAQDTLEMEGVAPFPAGSVSVLLRAAPLLRDIDVSIGCDLPTALRLLRGEPPFAQLRLRQLRADLDGADAAVLLADVAACRAPLTGLSLERTPLDAPGALDALVDVLRARQPPVSAVKLTACRLSVTSAPALARLLGNGALRVLHVCGREPGHDADLLDAPAAALLGAALRANTQLTSLAVTHLHFWRDAPAAAALLDALTGHPTLRSLHLGCNGLFPATYWRVAGAALGALVAADAPLRRLDLACAFLGDEGMRPLVNALPTNTHLCVLDCSHNDISAAFARNVLLPAVRANASLRELDATTPTDDSASEFSDEDDDRDVANAAVREAEELVAARTG